MQANTVQRALSSGWKLSDTGQEQFNIVACHFVRLEKLDLRSFLGTGDHLRESMKMVTYKNSVEME